MTHEEKRIYLINSLLTEQPRYRNIEIPADVQEQKDLLRSLMNVRLPAPVSDEYVRIESEYLKEETAAKGVTCLADLKPVEDGIYLWQGDITLSPGMKSRRKTCISHKAQRIGPRNYSKRHGGTHIREL